CFLASWRRADEAAEIGHAHIARLQIGGDQRPLADPVDVEIAFKIALADAPGEIAEADALAAIVVVEMPAQRIGRRRLQRQMEELVEIREVFAFQLEL